MNKLFALILFLTGFTRLPACAKAALLVEEPYGAFGSGVPTGHASIYLPQVCGVTPTELRHCNPGELGVVISRYHRVAGRDWLAIPLLPYLYAVDRAEEVPAFADEATVRSLRDEYRRANLRGIAPDTPDGSMPEGDWIQLVGASYDRQVYMFEFDATPSQDAKLIATLNSQSNRSHFNLFFHNCADFSRKVINFYHPGATQRSLTADLGITTPKQLAKSLVNYNKRHDDLDLTAFVIPQVPGTIERSHPPRGVLESLLKTKKYVIPLSPLAVMHPFFAAGVVATYFFSGHFQPEKASEMLQNPEQVAVLAEHFAHPEEPGSSPGGAALSRDDPAGSRHSTSASATADN